MARFPGMWSRRKVGGAVALVIVVVLAVVGNTVLPPGDDGDNRGPGGGGNGGDGGGSNAGDGGGDGVPAGVGSNGTVTLPPGINETGVVDADALLAAHRTALVESGFAYRYVNNRTRFIPYNEDLPPSPVIRVTGEVRATADLARVAEHVDRDVPTEEEITTWTNGTAGGRRVVADGTTYERSADAPIPRIAHHYLIRNFVVLGVWNLTAVRGTGPETRFVLTSNHTRRLADVGVDSHVRNFTGRMVVDPEGRIRYFEVNVTNDNTVVKTPPAEDETIGSINRRHLVFELTTVGNVSVPPPEWLNRTGRVTGDPTAAPALALVRGDRAAG